MIYEQLPHNPGYKLIEVEIENKTFVYAEANNGINKGLEIYYYKPNNDHFYTSRRYNEGKIPQIYTELYNKLKSLSSECKEGFKITLDIAQFKTLR